MKNERKLIFEETDENKKKIEKLQLLSDEVKPKINVLYEQIKSIKEAINENYNEIKKINKDWFDKEKKFKEYMDIVNYIKEATEKKKQLQKWADKRKKNEEKYAAKNKENNPDAVVEVTVKKDTTFLHEISVCNWLIKYFENLIGVGASCDDKGKSQNQKANTNSKIDEDLKKGLLKEMKDNDDEMCIGFDKKPTKNKEKTKKDKKAVVSNYVLLDSNVVSQLKEVNLKAPSLRNEVPALLKELAVKLEGFKNPPVVEQPTAIATVTATVTETKASVSPKKEAKVEEKAEAKVEIKTDVNVKVDVTKENSPKKEKEKVSPKKEKAKEKEKEKEKVTHVDVHEEDEGLPEDNMF